MVVIVLMGLGVRVAEELACFPIFSFFCLSFIFWFLYFIRELTRLPGSENNNKI